MHRILEFVTEQTPKLSGITIGSAAAGTAAGTLDNETLLTFMHTDLLSLLQYAAYTVSVVVGILTIVSWCRRNKKNKKVT